VLLTIAGGGALGAVARYGLGRVWSTPAASFPATTLAVNLVGCLLLGFLLTLLTERFPPATHLRAFACIGVLGSFTTFSAFAVETDLLLETGRVGPAAAYLGATLVGGLFATAMGMFSARSVAPGAVRR